MSFKSDWVEFNGYIMRSRAEMHLAHALDRLGIFYVYEHMPFDGFSGYLPDFYLPNLNAFIEVKGKEPTGEEKEKCERLGRQTGLPVLIVYGKPNIFRHHDHLDGYVREEVSWVPILFMNGVWSRLVVNRLCRAVYHLEGKRAGEKFVCAFDFTNVGKLQRIGPTALQVHDDIARKIGKTSRLIYEHNGPVNHSRLIDPPKASRYETIVLGYLQKQEAA